MAYGLIFTNSAKEDLLHLHKREQARIVRAVESQLEINPLKPARNRKPLRSNDLSAWELRVDQFRIFYDVDAVRKVITIKAIGWKEHNKLFIRGKEYRL